MFFFSFFSKLYRIALGTKMCVWTVNKNAVNLRGNGLTSTAQHHTSTFCFRFHAHQHYSKTLRQICSSVAATLSSPSTSNDFLTLNDRSKNAHKRIYRQYVWCMPYRIDGLSDEPMMMVMVMMTCVRPVLVNKFHFSIRLLYSSASCRYTRPICFSGFLYAFFAFVFLFRFWISFSFFWYCPVCRRCCRRLRRRRSSRR